MNRSFFHFTSFQLVKIQTKQSVKTKINDVVQISFDLEHVYSSALVFCLTTQLLNRHSASSLSHLIFSFASVFGEKQDRTGLERLQSKSI